MVAIPRKLKVYDTIWESYFIERLRHLVEKHRSIILRKWPKSATSRSLTDKFHLTLFQEDEIVQEVLEAGNILKTIQKIYQ